MNRRGQFFIITAVLIAGALITITTILTASETINYNAVLERHDTDILENVADITESEWWDQDWQFRKRVVVEEEAGQFLTGEAVTLYLDARNERVEDDCDDIRVIVDGRSVPWTNTTSCDIDTYDTDTDAEGRWTMDEGSGTTVEDVAGTSDATFQGSPSWVSGRSGSGVLFESGDFLDIGNAEEFVASGQPWTVMFWFRPDSVDSGNVYHITGVEAQQDGAWSVFSHFGIRDSRLTWWDEDDGWRSSNTDLEPGRWYHGALSHDGEGNTTFWLNGEPDGTADIVGAGDDVTIENIGRRGHSNDRYFRGTLDDVRIYAAEFSADEMRGIYNDGIGLNASLDMLPRERLSDVAVYYGNPSAADPGHTAADLNVTALSQRPTVVQVGPDRSQQEIAEKMAVYVDRFDELISPSITLQRREGRCDLLTLQSTTAVLDREIC